MTPKIWLKLALVLALSCNGLNAQETFKTMFYNVLNFPLQDASKISSLEVILDDYRPDLFMVCELNNLTGANAILDVLQNINPNFTSAQFVNNTSDDNGSNQNDLQNLIFYDSSKFILESQGIITTSLRDFNHYKLKLNTVNQSTEPVILDVFVCHLKASGGTNNQQIRLQMVQALEDYLADSNNGFNSNSNVLLAGDLNIYRNTEPAFAELTDTSNLVTFIDPANRVGSWHNNTSYLDVFTQSTRTQTGQGGATGGFDDRFDFILTSESMQDDNVNNDISIEFVPDSYQVYGNNSNINCYNQEINSNNCAEDNNPDTPDFDITIRNALYTMSDHLPVTLELRTTEELLSTSEFVANSTEIIKFTNGNVANSILNLGINTSLKNESLKIFSVLGQEIATINVNNKNQVAINVSQFKNGIYFITTPKIQKPLKFIKVN